MKKTILTIALVSGAYLTNPALAEDPTAPREDAGPAATAELTEEEYQTRKLSIPVMESRISDRTARIDLLIGEIEKLDARIEERVGKVVENLEKYKDSQDSKIRVAETKQDVMQALGDSIDRYNKTRTEVMNNIAAGKSADDEKAEELVDSFDEKIDKRISQIVDLSKTFTDHKDYKKYVNDGGGYGYGRWYRNGGEKVNEKWKQNRRETTQTDKQRKEVIDALTNSISELERDIKAVQAKLDAGSLSDAQKGFYQQDVERNEKALAERKAQLAKMMDFSNEASTVAIGRRQAHELQLMIRELMTDIRQDSDDMYRKFDDLKRRANELAGMKENLEARKKWLAEYESKHK
ncbi:hypothetical protein [Persicirhabdus sediminis]|uniref:Uncharacterized protein n=1 Tax=Persicirhabdus sediminis TaxID=454144 RepID=A0A8J7ME36_9BACT|nr:hypothetical protein [Persicirhabdus sediminis]MBK1790843.1 hypothetical protein [Persicirhabdus sediminis]